MHLQLKRGTNLKRVLLTFYTSRHIYSANILIKALNSTEKATYKGKQGGKTFQYPYYVILINKIA